jgi:hypothetical protein
MDLDPQVNRLRPGATLTAEGAAAGDVLFLLDGILAVEVDGRGGDRGRSRFGHGVSWPWSKWADRPPRCGQ